MKKIVASILLCSTLLLSHALAIDLYVDGEKLAPETVPVMINNRTLVPLRCIFEALQAEVTWDNARQIVRASKGDLSVSIAINETIALVNETHVDLDTPAIIQNGSTMVPVRFVAEALNAEVSWDADTQSVYVVTNPTAEEDIFSTCGLTDDDIALLGAIAEREAIDRITTPEIKVGSVTINTPPPPSSNMDLDGMVNVFDNEATQLPPTPQSKTVYITKTGQYYHYNASCDGGFYDKSTLSAAKAKGLIPCSNCVN